MVGTPVLLPKPASLQLGRARTQSVPPLRTKPQIQSVLCMRIERVLRLEGFCAQHPVPGLPSPATGATLKPWPPARGVEGKTCPQRLPLGASELPCQARCPDLLHALHAPSCGSSCPSSFPSDRGGLGNPLTSPRRTQVSVQVTRGREEATEPPLPPNTNPRVSSLKDVTPISRSANKTEK